MEVAQYLKEKADTKRKKLSSQKRKITAVTEKFTWSNEMLEDLVDIVCSDEETKKMLIFRNQKFAADNALNQKVVMELNKPIKGYENHFLLKLLSLKLETNLKSSFQSARHKV